MSAVLLQLFMQGGVDNTPPTIPGTVETLDTSLFPIEFATASLRRIDGNATHLFVPCADGGPYFTGHGFLVSLRNGASPTAVFPDTDVAYRTMGVDPSGNMQLVGYDTNATSDIVVHTVSAGGTAVTGTHRITVAASGMSQVSPSAYLYDPGGAKYLLFGYDLSFNMRVLESNNPDLSAYTPFAVPNGIGVSTPQQVVAFAGLLVGYRGGVMETFDRASGYTRTVRFTPASVGNFGLCMCVRPGELAAWNRNGLVRTADGINYTTHAITVDTSFPADEPSEYFPCGSYDYMRRGSRLYRAVAGANHFVEITGAWGAGISCVGMTSNYPGLAAVSREAGAGTGRFLNYLR